MEHSYKQKPNNKPIPHGKDRWLATPRYVLVYHGSENASPLNLGVASHLLSTQCMGVSKNSGTTKSSILIGFSIINHPFWDTPIFGNTRVGNSQYYKQPTPPFEVHHSHNGKCPLAHLAGVEGHGNNEDAARLLESMKR